jgi:anthranilate phosphoribosyltransferase
MNLPASHTALPSRSGAASDKPSAVYLRSFLPRLMRGEDLTRSEASRLLEGLLDSEVTDAQIAATLVALSLKGETVEELTGLAAAMRARATRISAAQPHFIDTAGTGSSSVKTFNVSTAAAFVIAGAGLPVAKHGNRAVTSLTGSADALAALGVNIAVAPEVSESCLNAIGICFMFAPLYHGSTARVAAVRRELGIQTVFNLLGPLTNPAGAPLQVIGVWKEGLVEPLAQVLAALGTRRAWVVHGLDGLDEISLAAKTRVAEAHQGMVRTFEISPDDFGFGSSALGPLRGNNAESSARMIRAVLEGEQRDQARAIVVINAAAALFVGGAAQDLRQAARMAEESIDSGAARAKLTELARMTNQ